MIQEWARSPWGILATRPWQVLKGESGPEVEGVPLFLIAGLSWSEKCNFGSTSFLYWSWVKIALSICCTGLTNEKNLPRAVKNSFHLLVRTSNRSNPGAPSPTPARSSHVSPPSRIRFIRPLRSRSLQPLHPGPLAQNPPHPSLFHGFASSPLSRQSPTYSSPRILLHSLSPVSRPWLSPLSPGDETNTFPCCPVLQPSFAKLHPPWLSPPVSRTSFPHFHPQPPPTFLSPPLLGPLLGFYH